jgi:hypothetical protein
MTNGNQFNRVTAETNVIMDWVDDRGPNHATADKAVYTKILTNLALRGESPHLETNAAVVLTGNSIFTNNSVTLQADPIVYDLITGAISTTNMQRTTIPSTGTNSSSLLDTSTVKPSKTNALPK